MALISLSELVSNIRGSIGGTTFARNRAGLIAKRKSQGHKVYTTKQSNIIKIQSFVVGQWQFLSLENQELWNDYADLYEQVDKFGTTKQLSGFNWFCHVNNINYAQNSTIIESPPERESASVVPEYTVSLSTTNLSISMSTAIDFPNESLYIFASLPTHQTNKSNRGGYRLIEIVTDPDFTNRDLTDAWSEAFGFDWSSITTNSKFNIQLFIYTVNNNSFQNSVGVPSVGGFAPPAPWSPADLDNLAAWFLSDTGITLNSGNVSEWEDQSGNGNNLAQGTAANQPLYVEDVLNGYPVLQFDATNDKLFTSSFGLSQPCTIVVLFKQDGGLSLYSDLHDGLTTDSGLLECTNAGTNTWKPWAGSYMGSGKVINQSDWHLSIINFNGASSNWYLDSQSVETGNAGSTNMNGFTLGANYSRPQYFGGKIAECFITTDSLTPTQVNLIRNYINDRYNLSF